MKRKLSMISRLVSVMLCLHSQVLAQDYATDLLNKLPSLSDSEAVTILYEVGNLYYLKGMNDSAINYFTQSLTRAKKTKDKKKVWEINLSIAKAQIHLQKFDEATGLLFSCISNGEKESYHSVVATAKSLVSFVYNFQGKTKEALHFALESERVFIEQKDTTGLIFVYPMLITSLGQNGDTTKALSYFDKGIRLFEKYENSNRISSQDKEHLPLKRMALIFNSVNLMEKKTDLLKARQEVNEVNEIIEKRNNLYEKFEVATLIAVINLKLKNFKIAQQFAEKAVELVNPENVNHGQLADVYHIISDASDSLGEYQKAYKAMSMFKQFNDSIFKTSSLEAVHTVEAKFETSKKEEKIAKLSREKKNQRNLIIISIVSVLILSLLLLFVLRSKKLQKKLLVKEKEIQKAGLEIKLNELEQTALRAQMNPHFIFNSLNSVQRFVINNDIKGVNNYLSAFANLIRQTLENSGKQMIPLKDELLYLDAYIQLEQMRGRENFDYVINLDKQIDTSAIYIPNIMVQPFVENSIQHGLLYKSGIKGKLELTITMNEKINIIVEDNGTGINNTITKKQNAEKNHESMGTSITTKRISLYNSLHNDKIELIILDKSETGGVGTGTRVILKFPINKR